jgi:phage shock protein A
VTPSPPIGSPADPVDGDFDDFDDFEYERKDPDMRFIDRLTLLVKADAHGVLEQLEERTLLAKQHLREAELELVHKRARALALEDEARRLEEEAVRLERECSALDEDVELALANDEQELARFSLRRLLPRQRAALDVRHRIAEIDERRQRLALKLASQEREYEELQRQVRTRLAAAREEEKGAVWCGPEVAADEEVEIELLRRRTAAVEDAR